MKRFAQFLKVLAFISLNILFFSIESCNTVREFIYRVLMLGVLTAGIAWIAYLLDDAIKREEKERKEISNDK